MPIPEALVLPDPGGARLKDPARDTAQPNRRPPGHMTGEPGSPVRTMVTGTGSRTIGPRRQPGTPAQHRCPGPDTSARLAPDPRILEGQGGTSGLFPRSFRIPEALVLPDPADTRLKALAREHGATEPQASGAHDR